MKKMKGRGKYGWKLNVLKNMIKKITWKSYSRIKKYEKCWKKRKTAPI